MQVPLEITHRNIDKSDAVEQAIRDHAAKLEKLCGGRLNSCRVAVERPNKHPTSGSDFRIRIDLTVAPRHELAVSRDPNQGDIHDDIYMAVRDAFDMARKRVKRVLDEQRGEVKSHPEQQVAGVISQLGPEFGFIQSAEGREIYFHPHSVVDDKFEDLREGMGVAFMEEPGEKGPQASTVRVVDHRGHRNGG